MGIAVSVSRRDIAAPVDTALARSMREAGAIVLATSDALAPKEPVPRHGVHGVETGTVRVAPFDDGYEAQVGYGAFWMRYQHEHYDWHHPHGGEAGFLVKAAALDEEAFWSAVAEGLRSAIEGSA